MKVTATDVAALAGRSDDPEFVAVAGRALVVVAAMAKAYTRGNGYDTGDLDPVVLAATVRLASNPEGLVMEQVGDYTVRPGTFTGWTLPELAVLNGYRKRAR